MWDLCRHTYGRLCAGFLAGVCFFRNETPLNSSGKTEVSKMSPGGGTRTDTYFLVLAHLESCLPKAQKLLSSSSRPSCGPSRRYCVVVQAFLSSPCRSQVSRSPHNCRWQQLQPYVCNAVAFLRFEIFCRMETNGITEIEYNQETAPDPT